ncbi:hypothetical protein TRFO_38627 [Tritrichomonas foetus]|uniref:Uncharacterized protein n=1 Tax=Tritrichomonas foetus TaxID=1144522 RepID=A0A1J4J7W1_9EUKA|nr:hypothetical protein TRFO_38627 [Tritrichomonas foetus]|eukprot:OHS95286.1 hypothetical protein TRFO_38627 [Tritrichomonas foetus]
MSILKDFFWLKIYQNKSRKKENILSTFSEICIIFECFSSFSIQFFVVLSILSYHFSKRKIHGTYTGLMLPVLLLFLLLPHGSSFKPSQNVTIQNLHASKFLSQAPLLSFGGTSRLLLSNSAFRKFISPLFVNNGKLNYHFKSTNFDHFTNSGIMVNRIESGCAVDMTIIEADEGFEDCTFTNIDLLYDGIIAIVSPCSVFFDRCQFINSKISEEGSIILVDSDLVSVEIRNCLFSNNQLSNSFIIDNAECYSEIKITETNFTKNHSPTQKILQVDHIPTLKHVRFEDNLAFYSVLLLTYSPQPDYVTKSEKLLEAKNQINSEKVTPLYDIVFLNNIILPSTHSNGYDLEILANKDIFIDKIRISETNDTNLGYYRHFLISTDFQNNINVHISNCCLSLPKSKWIEKSNAITPIFENNEENDDCFDLHPKKVRYGVIGTYDVILNIPRRLLEFFP